MRRFFVALALLIAPFSAATVANAAPAVVTDGSTLTAPPVEICGSSTLHSTYGLHASNPLDGTTNVVTVAAGSTGYLYDAPSTTYYFAPGVHYLGQDVGDQIPAEDGDVYIGEYTASLGPAIIDGDDGGFYNDFAFVANYLDIGVDDPQDVTVQFLTIENFTPLGGNGAVNTDAGTDWTIKDDTIEGNDPGAAVMLGSGDVLQDNCLTDNGEYAFDAYVPAADGSSLTGGPEGVTVKDNEISYNDQCNWEANPEYTSGSQPDPWYFPTIKSAIPSNCNPGGSGYVGYYGCGCAGGGKFWRVDGATVEDNYIHDNYDVGFWADTNNDGIELEDNWISNNFAEGIDYELSYNTDIKNSVFEDNGWGAGSNPYVDFPTGAIYISESGGDSRVPNGDSISTITISKDTFTDNWGGVVEWESSDRFCGNGLETNAVGVCTLVAPSTYYENTVADAVTTTAGSATISNATDWVPTVTAPAVGDAITDSFGYIPSGTTISNVYSSGGTYYITMSKNATLSTGGPYDEISFDAGTSAGGCGWGTLYGSSSSGSPDYFDNCRWKTQNVSVTDNDFNFNSGNVPDCDDAMTGSGNCGQNGVFSQYGSAPLWSPYLGTGVDTAITTGQDNTWTHNAYTQDGSIAWTFDYATQNTSISWSAWQADHEDTTASGSTYTT